VQYTRNYNFASGQIIVADQVDLELDSLATVVNSGIDTANIVDGAITADKCATNINPETRAAEIFVDGVYSGLILNPASGWANRVASITAGTSYIRGRRVSTSTQTDHTFTASKDTYVDLDKNMNFTYVEAANAGAEPAVTANSLRIMKVVTDASKIVVCYDRRPWQWIAVQPYRVGSECGTFHNSWVNFNADGLSYNQAAFMKDQIGMIHLRGFVKSGTVGTAYLLLPPGFRPNTNIEANWFVTMSNDAIGKLLVYGKAIPGYCIPYGSNVWFCVDGITFKAES
jgi:hypothetical protein